jgi:hydrogenase-4 component E
MMPPGLNPDLIRTLSVTLLVTTVAAAETRKLKLAAAAYGVQALLIVALLLSFARINPTLYWWAGTALLTKAVLTPAVLYYYIRQVHETELKPLIGFAPSVTVAAILMVVFFRLTHSQVDLLAPTALAREEVFRTNLAVGATVFVMGLYAVLTRRDAIKTVIGLCLLENGVHLSLVSLVPDLPETTLFGIATEVVITAFLLLYVIAGVYRQFGTTDTLQMNELRG